MEPEAEKTCDHLASLALSSDPDNIEALDCLASVRLSQSRNNEAKQIVEKGIEVFGTLSPGSSIHLHCLIVTFKQSVANCIIGQTILGFLPSHASYRLLDGHLSYRYIHRRCRLYGG